jgi:hypothetical protein
LRNAEGFPGAPNHTADLCWRIAHLGVDIPAREYSSRYDQIIATKFPYGNL